MLGLREPEIYGSETLFDIETLCTKCADQYSFEIDFRQSNHEGEIVTWIQDAMRGFDALIINAAAYTHTSIAIHDALKLLTYPIIEVHISDPIKREKFRHFSYIEPVVKATIQGQGASGYSMAIKELSKILS